MDALVAANRAHRVTFTSQSVMALRAAIESGLGVGLLPPDSSRASAVRTLTTSAEVPAPLAVQYGLYAMTNVRPL